MAASQTHRADQSQIDASTSSSHIITSTATADESQHSIKKRRISKACDNCRLKKAKCNGKNPCTSCILNKDKCVYSDSRKKRGIPSGYTKELETKNFLLQLLLTKLLTEDDSVLLKLTNLLTDEDTKNEFFSQINDLNTTWHESSNIKPLFTHCLLNDLPKLNLDLKDPNLRPLQKNKALEADARTSPEDGTSGTVKEEESPIEEGSDNNISKQKDKTKSPSNDRPNLDALNFNKVALQYKGLSSTNSTFSPAAIQQYVQTLPPTTKSPFRVGSLFNIKSTSKNSLPTEILQFPLNTRKLVDSYFQVVHPWLPMVNRFAIVRYTHKSNVKDPNIDGNFIGLIWAILALGQFKFNGFINEESKILSLNCARNSIVSLETTTTSTIETIQSMLLLGLFYYEIGEWDSAWVLTSSASRMAVDTRLMINNNQQLLENEIKLRERTWSGVYLLNLMLSLRLGRSPVMRKADYPVPKISEDDWEEWDGWTEFQIENENLTLSNANPLRLESARCLSVHNKMLELVSLLNLIVTSYIEYSDNLDQSGFYKSDHHRLLNKSKEGFAFGTYTINPNETIAVSDIENELVEWFNSLPPHCQIRDSDEVAGDDSAQIPHFIALIHLFYHLSWGLLAIKVLDIKHIDAFNTIKILNHLDVNVHFEKSLKSITKILGRFKVKSLVLSIPYLDYFLSVAYKLNEVLDKNYDEDIVELLKQASTLSPSCKVTYNILKIMKEQNKNRRSLMAIYKDQQASHSSPHSQDHQDQNLTGNEALTQNVPESDILDSFKRDSNPSSSIKQAPMSDLQQRPTSGFFNRPQTIFSPISSLRSPNPPISVTASSTDPTTMGNDLDSFLIDMGPSTRNENKMKQFMKNLGYVGDQSIYEHALTPQIPANSTMSTALNENLAFTPGEIESIGLHEYLEHMAASNSRKKIE